MTEIFVEIGNVDSENRIDRDSHRFENNELNDELDSRSGNFYPTRRRTMNCSRELSAASCNSHPFEEGIYVESIRCNNISRACGALYCSIKTYFLIKKFHAIRH